MRMVIYDEQRQLVNLLQPWLAVPWGWPTSRCILRHYATTRDDPVRKPPNLWQVGCGHPYFWYGNHAWLRHDLIGSEDLRLKVAGWYSSWDEHWASAKGTRLIQQVLLGWQFHCWFLPHMMLGTASHWVTRSKTVGVNHVWSRCARWWVATAQTCGSLFTILPWATCYQGRGVWLIAIEEMSPSQHWHGGFSSQLGNPQSYGRFTAING